MVRALARNKPARNKPRRVVRPAKKKSSKLKTKSGASAKRVSSPKKPPKKAVKRAPETKTGKTGKKGMKQHRPATTEDARRIETGMQRATGSRVAPPPERPPRLLSDSKSTAAALSLLEKGIKLIFQKDFRKARAELKSLVETYPGEAEITVRARSYLQICEREEAAHKDPPVADDQLYALGVMEHNRGNYDAAIANFLLSLEEHPGADYIYYSLAASQALKGNAQEAIQSLRKAIELSEDNRIYAKNDADFSSLQSWREFSELVGINSSSDHESQQ
jgi:tetratricopeptide (TPR) repeat protein